MTLEEAIKQCEDIASYKEHDIELWNRSAGFWGNDNKYAVEKADECKKCAEEYRQLADWLKAYKQILESGDCNTCAKSGYCEYEPQWGEMVRFNCPLYVGGEAE